MGITFTIDDGSNARTFAAMSSTAGRIAIDISIDAPRYKKKQFQVPGVDGPYLGRLGKEGGKIVCEMRYIGLISDAEGLYKTDREAWANVACTITDDDSNTYTRCELLDMAEQGRMRALGRNSYVFINARAVFDHYGA